MYPREEDDQLMVKSNVQYDTEYVGRCLRIRMTSIGCRAQKCALLRMTCINAYCRLRDAWLNIIPVELIMDHDIRVPKIMIHLVG
jgi:hypothetical protein